MSTSAGSGPRLALGLATAVLLVSCGVAVGPDTSGAAGSRAPAKTSYVVGEVLAAPVCPVQRAEVPCRPRPVPNAKVELLRKGASLATTRTDARGAFRLSATQGAAVVRATNVGGYRSRAAKRIRLGGGHTVHVKLLLDTGIR
jgi:hypothetical protein